mmetsp:Transcript_23811/g.76747  ORF Transcript_23811/g.76747 Transcript_23811/m.76747 type:complete len:298 (-) Transcript_23811:907-1800(-)
MWSVEEYPDLLQRHAEGRLFGGSRLLRLEPDPRRSRRDADALEHEHGGSNLASVEPPPPSQHELDPGAGCSEQALRGTARRLRGPDQAGRRRREGREGRAQGRIDGVHLQARGGLRAPGRRRDGEGPRGGREGESPADRGAGQAVRDGGMGEGCRRHGREDCRRGRGRGARSGRGRGVGRGGGGSGGAGGGEGRGRGREGDGEGADGRPHLRAGEVRGTAVQVGRRAAGGGGKGARGWGLARAAGGVPGRAGAGRGVPGRGQSRRGGGEEEQPRVESSAQRRARQREGPRARAGGRE